MRFRVARLQANRLVKFGSGRSELAHLQQYQSQVVVCFREVWFAANELAKNTGGADQVVLPAQDEPQLNTRVRIPRVKADGLVQLVDRDVELA